MIHARGSGFEGGMTLESILTSIKKLLMIGEDYDHFDPDIIMHINSVFMTLTQIGIGPPEGFIIEDDSTTWSDYIADPIKQQAVKSYIYLKVKLLFDPPSSSSVLESFNRQAGEYEWRLMIDAETQSNGEEELQNG